MPAAFLALAASAYLVLLVLAPSFNPVTLPNSLRLLLLINGAALLVGVAGFLITFTRPSIPTQEETHG